MGSEGKREEFEVRVSKEISQGVDDVKGGRGR